jgi:hypothetical protein
VACYTFAGAFLSQWKCIFRTRDPQPFFPLIQQWPSWVSGNGVGFGCSTVGWGLLVGWIWGFAGAVDPGGTKNDRLEAVFHTAVAAAEGAFRAAVHHRRLLALTLTLDRYSETGRFTGIAVRLTVGAANRLKDGWADAIGTGPAARVTWHSARSECWCANLQARAVAAEFATGTTRVPGDRGSRSGFTCTCQVECLS